MTKLWKHAKADEALNCNLNGGYTREGQELLDLHRPQISRGLITEE